MTEPDATPTLSALVRDARPVAAHQAHLGATTPELLDQWYQVARPTPTHRPWTIVGMITSIDGATTIGGGSGQLGNATDRMALHAVRRAGQVVVAGAGTVRKEEYRPGSFPHCRVGVVTSTADLDYDRPLFADGVGFVITTEGAVVPAGVEVVRAGESTVDLAAALSLIHTVTGPIATVVIEGGPTLNGGFFARDLVDEVCVTNAPLTVAGASDRIATGDIERVASYRLAHLLYDSDGYSLARWVRH